ncbi:ABC transporter ATP-binding protein [Rhodanobacter aciditrophus]|uniref:ABC transporter ATP-binding protein n=1 Tax=Rhodanobacter aciditrophus TaxID=1623218 RepID=UPI003CF377FE
MSSDDLSICIQGLGKRYEIYAQPTDRLKQMMLPRLWKAAGRGERKYFEEFWALREVSFSVRRGETVGIIGRNGSGKSTLLQMICGTLHPTEGTVHVSGRIAALLELGAGFNPEFTGKENVFLSGLLYGIAEDELRRRFKEIVDFADIGGFIDQPVKTYSSGMYVRLAFAIAAHVDAETLIIDEALSVGDVRFTQKCMRYLRDFQQRGTLLFVSHDTSAVLNLCDRAVWLESGRMVMDGTARDVVEQYLAEQHANDRNSTGQKVALRVSAAKGSEVDAIGRGRAATDIVDSRIDILNGKAQRNLIEIFEFDESRINSEFGAGALRIRDVRLCGEDGQLCQLTCGGELVDLLIEADVLWPIDGPVFGFYIKDRLGQRLFGDNTYITYQDALIQAVAGERLQARFRFRMPILRSGDYSIDVAVATGTQQEHTQQHWIHDALAFRASESTMRHGLVGIPMQAIEIERAGANA